MHRPVPMAVVAMLGPAPFCAPAQARADRASASLVEREIARPLDASSRFRHHVDSMNEVTYEVLGQGGAIVGPVTLDQLRRGVAAGKVPGDSRARRIGAVDWLPVQRVLDAAVDRSKVAQTLSLVAANRYQNLFGVSSWLRGYGLVLKILGAVALVAGLLTGALGAGKLEGQSGALLAVGASVGGALLAVLLHVTGTLVAAMGEALLALGDIANNTGNRRLDGR